MLIAVVSDTHRIKEYIDIVKEKILKHFKDLFEAEFTLM